MIESISPYSVRMRKNIDQNNPEYRHFSCSEVFQKLLTVPKWMFGTEFIFSWLIGRFLKLKLGYGTDIFKYVNPFENSQICIYRSQLHKVCSSNLGRSLMLPNNVTWQCNCKIMWHRAIAKMNPTILISKHIRIIV